MNGKRVRKQRKDEYLLEYRKAVGVCQGCGCSGGHLENCIVVEAESRGSDAMLEKVIKMVVPVLEREWSGGTVIDVLRSWRR